MIDYKKFKCFRCNGQCLYFSRAIHENFYHYICSQCNSSEKREIELGAYYNLRRIEIENYVIRWEIISKIGIDIFYRNKEYVLVKHIKYNDNLISRFLSKDFSAQDLEKLLLLL